MTIQELLDSPDWAQIFGEENDGNVDSVVHVVPPGSSASDAPVLRADVKCIVAMAAAENIDWRHWLGVFLLRDGRYLIASGGCDYTGWGCRANNCLIVCESMKDVIEFGLTIEERDRVYL